MIWLVLLQPAAGALLSDVPMPDLTHDSRPADAIGFTAGPDTDTALSSPAGNQGMPPADGGSDTPQSCIGIFDGRLIACLPGGADEGGCSSTGSSMR